MKVTTMVDVGSIELDVEVTPDEIAAALFDEEHTLPSTLNKLCLFLKAIPDDRIKGDVSPGAKQLIRSFLHEQADRYQ